VSAELTLPLGAARLHCEFQKPDPLPPSAMRELRSRISEVLAPALGALRVARVSDHIAAGGTARALARLLVAREKNPAPGIRNVVVARAALARLTEELLESSHAERLAMPGMDPRRADLLPAGAAVLDGLVRDIGARSLTICDWGLREGVLLDAARERLIGAPQCAEWSRARAQLV
jgi:exopolyphosphatase/guanosine-5'-triphosphate,3'-diphosphate pyrophosphatase